MPVSLRYNLELLSKGIIENSADALKKNNMLTKIEMFEVTVLSRYLLKVSKLKNRYFIMWKVIFQ